MTSKTVRIDQETWEVLKELAGLLGEPMQKVLARAIEAHRRQLVLENPMRRLRRFGPIPRRGRRNKRNDVRGTPPWLTAWLKRDAAAAFAGRDMVGRPEPDSRA